MPSSTQPPTAPSSSSSLSSSDLVPQWLKSLPSAPKFHPTPSEFADPVAYILLLSRSTNISLLTDYIKSEHVMSGDAADPIIMKGYQYLVLGEEKVKTKTKRPEYVTELPTSADVVTVEEVGEVQGFEFPALTKLRQALPFF